MRLSHRRMMDRFMAADPEFDGRFTVGVLTTGIYCRPSCHARKPKAENVRFFDSPAAARAASLRACLKCKPDAAQVGVDEGEVALSEITASLADVSSVSALARLTKMTTTRLTAEVRRLYHSTPLELISQAKIDRACQLLDAGATPLAASMKVGYESESAFYEAFRRRTGMTPGCYARLDTSSALEIAFPTPVPIPPLLGYFGRDPRSRTVQVKGNEVAVALRGPSGPTQLPFRLEPMAVQAVAESGEARWAHQVLVRMLGLSQDVKAFESLAHRRGYPELVGNRSGLRIPQTATAFEGMMWAIVGQQISLPFAFTLMRTLTELAGEAAGDMMAMPSPSTVSQLQVEDLTARQFSTRKAEYLIAAAGQVASGELPLEAMRSWTTPSIQRRLLAVRGLGPWATQYMLMRAYGRADCLPLGDTGLAAGARQLFNLDPKPPEADIAQKMATFAPYRSLATFHLWQRLKEGVA